MREREIDRDRETERERERGRKNNKSKREREREKNKKKKKKRKERKEQARDRKQSRHLDTHVLLWGVVFSIVGLRLERFTVFMSTLLVESEVAKKSVSARPGPILEGTPGTRMGPGRAGMAPTSGPGWVRNDVKQSTWQIWTGPLRTQDGTWTGQGSDPVEGLDGTPRDSNRLLGLSD